MRVQPTTPARLEAFARKQDAPFRDTWLNNYYGDLHDHLSAQYERDWTRDRANANESLRNFYEQHSGPVGLPIGASDTEIEFYAREQAGRCRMLSSIDACLHVFERAGIDPPSPDLPANSRLRRAQSWTYWRRKVRRKNMQQTEAACIDAGLVHRKADKYISTDGLERIRKRDRKAAQLLDDLIAVNECEFSLSLLEAASKGVSNPVNRRNELMTRLSGFETIALERADAAEFYTITCPSRFHARNYDDGSQNKNYDGSTPRDAQVYLCQVWARIRAALHRRNLSIYGIRIAEPHHDGAPHWHLLLWMHPGDRHAVRQIMAQYALAESPDEPGAAKHRFTIKAIDPDQGSAVGYVSKYISKNIDSHGLDERWDQGGDVDDQPIEAAERVRAWASTWGIRQFQQIGGPPVGVWRELRRIEDGTHDLIEQAREHADAGDWAGYVRDQGGPLTPRDAQPLRVCYEYNDDAGEYGDPIGWQVWGVQARLFQTVCTREHEWKIYARADIEAARSPVNNCTIEDRKNLEGSFETITTGPPGPPDWSRNHDTGTNIRI